MIFSIPGFRYLLVGFAIGIGLYLVDTYAVTSSVKLGTYILAGTSFSLLLGKLKRDAETDPLSGLLNKRGLKIISHSILKQAKKNKDTFCIGIIDLDEFKEINDHHGHLLGDKLIEDFAKVLKQNIRKSDIAARFGGDEFVLVFRKADLQEAEEIVCRIKNAAKTELGINFSCGIASYPQNAQDWETLFDRADDALWSAKVHRGKVVCCN